MTIRMTGRDALTYAQAHDLTLSTHTDPTAEGRESVTVEEARRIASEDPSLVYLDVPASVVERLADEAASAGDKVLADTCRSARAGWPVSQRLVWLECRRCEGDGEVRR